jgi:Family of unknown function (DUF5681)
MTTETDPQRTEEGRFAPGHSGNPAGRPKGARNRATLLDEALREGEDAAIVRRYIDRALAGDSVALRVLFRALVPMAKGRPIELAIDAPGADPVAAYDAALGAIVRGEMTIEEGLQFAKLLVGRRDATGWRPRRPEAVAPEAPAAAPPPAPMNRHERRRLAALMRGAEAACISPVFSGAGGRATAAAAAR